MPAALDSVLERLLKYRPAVFRQGELALDASRATAVVLAVVAVALAVLVVVTYRRARADAGARDRTVLAALRLATLGLLVGCLLRPVLVLSAAVPRRNTVAVLVDDSRSMRVPDEGGKPRADFARAAFGSGSRLLAALSDQFAVRVYRFSDVARRVDAVDSLEFAGGRTQLGAALQRVREDLEGVPLAGVVVVTDGADAAPAALADAALALRARRAPVFTVGVGRERGATDVEVARVEVPRAVLRGSTVEAEVLLSHAGLAGATVPLVVEDEGRIVATRDVTLPAEGNATPVRVAVPAATPGERRLTFRVPRQRGEGLEENNARTALVHVAERRERILYFEGEPRFELKFLRRAVAADEGLRVVTLQRSAENKYLRLDVADSLDLVGGFPTTRDELFAYKAVILGSVEASAFTRDQLRLLADFVGERGGALLLLGGRRAFAEGGYGGTPLEEVMPVVLEPPARGANASDGAAVAPATELAVRLTAAGASHASLQLAADGRASAARWSTLPPLTAVNVIRRAKPGATVLLGGQTPEGASRIVLAYQRYGRGKAAALPVQDTWLWQMHAAIPVEDQTHELFWRQTLRWLLAGVPDPVTVAASTERPEPGEPVTLRAEVRDSQFAAVNGAEVAAEVTAPSGARTTVPMEWGVSRDGEYEATYTPREAGVHAVRVTWRRRGGAASAAPLASEPTHFEAAESREEYFAAGMRAPLLRRLAEETGGRFYTPATVAALPEDLRYARGGVTVVERKELWDMPVTFLLLGVLVGAEWGYRRWRGMA